MAITEAPARNRGKTKRGVNPNWGSTLTPKAAGGETVPAVATQVTVEKQKRNISLRAARPRDLSKLYDCLIRYFDELSLYYPGPVEGPTIQWGMGIVNAGGCVVAECDGEIIGTVGLEIGAYPWNPSVKYLNGAWLWVVPEFRKGFTGIKLIEAAKEIGRANHMPVRLDEIWRYRPDLMRKMKERLGFHYVGGNYVYFPNDPNPPKDEA